MKKWWVLICFLCNVLNATPYIKRFWKPIIFKEETETAFDRNNLIPIDEGEYHYSEGLPEAPKTIETIISAGSGDVNSTHGEPQTLSADNIIKYLKENERHPSELKKINIDNIHVMPVRKINLQ